MPQDRNSYRNITKSIGILGGTKVFQVLISIIKNKFVAVLLGPSGMGIVGMITSTTDIITSLTGFGLRTSSVRDVSQSFSNGRVENINKTVTILHKLVLFTGLLGTLVTFFLSKYLSEWSFGNSDYTVAFKLVSIILFFDQLCVGQTVLIQGTFHYKFLAKSSLLGSILGLFLSVPLYYLWGEKAIVPVIIITSLSNMLLSWYYSKKIKTTKVNLSINEIIKGGKTMLILGTAIAVTGVIGTGQVYLLRLLIANYGNISDVGLYTAGMSIASSYIGVILTAMGTDYSPRLSAVSNDKQLFTQTINRQINLLITLIAPLIVIFIIFIKQLTILLYSSDFLGITSMLEWVMLGMFLRAISWCLSYSCIAKGDSKMFLINESVTTIYSLLLSIVGYLLYGFTGMGVAFCLTYFLYSIQLYFVCKKRYGYSISIDFFNIVLPQLIVSFGFFFLLKIVGYSYYRYIIGSIGIIMIIMISYYYLNKMMDINSLIKGICNKLKN